MNRVRVSGVIINTHEQIVEMSDRQLQEFRNNLRVPIENRDQAIDEFLGENYGDTDPIDFEYGEWSAELIGDDNKVIEFLDQG